MYNYFLVDSGSYTASFNGYDSIKGDQNSSQKASEQKDPKKFNNEKKRKNREKSASCENYFLNLI